MNYSKNNNNYYNNYNKSRGYYQKNYKNYSKQEYKKNDLKEKEYKKEYNKNKQQLDCFGIIYYKKMEKEEKKNYYGYINCEKLSGLFNIKIFVDRIYLLGIEQIKDNKSISLDIYLKTTKNNEKLLKFILNKEIDIKNLKDLFIGKIQKKNDKLIFTLELRDKVIEIGCTVEKYNDISGKIILDNPT